MAVDARPVASAATTKKCVGVTCFSVKPLAAFLSAPLRSNCHVPTSAVVVQGCSVALVC